MDSGLKRIISRLIITALVLIALAGIAWCFVGVNLSFHDLLAHKEHGWKTLKQFWPPDWSIRDQAIVSMVATLQMAVVGTVLGAVIALPISFFAARTTSLVRGLSSVIKTVMNVFRATPIVVYAIVLTSMVGLGKQTGTLAIAVGTFVMLTKLYAEALESISPGPVEAVRSVGGSTPQVFVYGMLPQVFPNYISTTLYAFELNLQASFILGFVGAGGIGYDILNYTRMFDWHKLCTILIITVVIVNLVDFISYRIRAALA